MKSKYFLTEIELPDDIILDDYHLDIKQMIKSDLYTTYGESIKVRTFRTSLDQDYKSGFVMGAWLGAAIAFLIAFIITIL